MCVCINIANSSALFLFQNTVYTMDLRSAHKIPEKPPPRLRLSLTRSLGPNDEDEPYGPSRPDSQPTHLKSLQRRSLDTCLISDSPSPTQQDWEGLGVEEEDTENSVGEEEEDDDDEVDAKKKSKCILNGMCVRRSAS